MKNYLKTTIHIYGSSFNSTGPLELLTNGVTGKSIFFKTSNNVELGENFSATINAGKGNVVIDSDLTGLKSVK